MATWVKRSFANVGITQVPPGPGLVAVQRRHSNGTVMLLIDVSGSMQGSRLELAVIGAKQFVDEAVEARYRVGMILWHTGVADLSMPSEDAAETYALLAQASFPSGGTDLFPALDASNDVLRDHDGDRVVAIFGDGDLGTPYRVMPLVDTMKGENIRFITRGLGDQAAKAFSDISDEEPDQVRIANESNLASGIAGMAAALRGSRS